MQKDSKIILISGLIIAVVIVGLVVFLGKNTGPGQLDGFATCLSDQGAVFYGAFWCPHCQTTKKLFGNSADKLPYVECSTPDGNGQTQVCIDHKIKDYPTWIFKDGSELHGEVTLDQLSAKTGCSVNSVMASSTATTSAANTNVANVSSAIKFSTTTINIK